MRLNLQLVRASQFLQQFKLDVRYKPGKKYIILDALSQLANANIGQADPFYLELNALFIYNTTLVKICPELISSILAGYKANNYWLRLQRQIQVNEDLGVNKLSLLFMLSLIPLTNTDPYLTPRPENEAKVLLAPQVSRFFSVERL